MSIVFQKISKTFISARQNKQFSIKNFSVRIDSGECVCFIGKSGSGKTTLLKMVNRLIEPDEGSISLNHRNIVDFELEGLRRNIGYVIQQGGLFPNMTIAQNIMLIGKLESWSRDKISERCHELMEIVNLPYDQFARRYPFELSGGQRQRVGIARALAVNPEFILMDEPFGALDPMTRADILSEFVSLRQRLHKTIIMVSHDLREAFKLGDRVALIDNGQLLQIGTPDDLKHRPLSEYVENFVKTYFD